MTLPLLKSSLRQTDRQSKKVLTSLINSDGSGATKTTEKWKKVWSDFKNNTKKKAARLHRAASGTGGGPAVYAKLTDLEQRALNIIGVLAATGLAIQEAGFSQEIHMEPEVSQAELTQFVVSAVLEDSHSTQEIGRYEPGPSSRADCVDSENYQYLQDAGNVDQSFTPAPCTLVPNPPESHDAGSVPQEQPAQSAQQTTPRRARRSRLSPYATRARGSPRRCLRPLTRHTEQAAQHFLQSDADWREFKKEQHREHMETKREQNRLREMEIQVQRGWQALGSRVLDIADKYINK